MYDFAAEPGNNELTVSEGEIIVITNPVRKLRWNQDLRFPDLLLADGRKKMLGDIWKLWLPSPEELTISKYKEFSNSFMETNALSSFRGQGPSQIVPTLLRICLALFPSKQN